ncbi:MAG TPA: PD-(D/E)XK nuclease family protein, partial [Acidimicrobiia bacterium]|nr:PD-(D/E)XK nuclease family protein [Acidimicrobiia bacterium]
MGRADVEGPALPVAPIVAGAGRAAREALWGQVRAAKHGDPLAPVTVAVPSPYAGLSLRRALGRQGGLVNVRFLPLARIAELLGGPRLAEDGRVPLTAARRAEAVHAALHATPGPFAAVATQPSTEDRLSVTFADLRRAPDSTLTALTVRGPRAAAVADLYVRYRELTAASYDEEDLALAAAAAVEDGAPGLDELGTVILFLPRPLSVAERAFASALAAGERLRVVVTATASERLASPVADRILQAADPEDEARATIRRLLGRAENGVPFHQLAILYTVAEPYARLVPELLDSAGVPWTGPSPRLLADSVAGRVLTGALDLIDADFARDAVAGWLGSGPILDRSGHRIPGTRWDLVSRAAGIVAGEDQWRDRLASRREALDEELRRLDPDDEPAWRVGRLERDRDHVAALEDFVGGLFDATRVPVPTRWATLAAWARGLLDRYLGGEGRRGDWPERELDAARRVDAALDDLADLDDLGADVDLARFRAALDTALAGSVTHVGRYGTGIFVGPVHAAVGTEFTTIAVVGGFEGALPPRGRDDPFLPEDDRVAVGTLATVASRRADGRDDFVAALAAATETILCFPRADPRAQQGRLPARWVVDTASAHAGRPVTAEELRGLDAQPWLDVVASFEQGVTSDAAPASLTEWDLRSLDEWRKTNRRLTDYPLADTALGRGFALAAGRSSNRFTVFGGNVGTSPLLAHGPDRPVSATAFQDWASCPFRYLVGRVLEVREVARPEAAESISALDEGTLVHAILESFVRDQPPRSPDQPWSDADRARMLEVVDRHCADADARGITGRPLLWRLARRRIRRVALHFLTVDSQLRAASGTIPTADGLEVPFGMADRAGVTVALPRSRSVTFRGRIDRVDRSPDGRRVIVYDYKTGRRHDEGLDRDPVVGGQRLQLPIYGMAASADTEAEDVWAYYWYTRPDIPDDPRDGYALDDRVQTRFVEVLDTIVDGIDQGCFPAYPGVRDYD